MATSSADVINSFLYRIELDRKFFNYHNVDSADALEIAQKRAGILLIEACGRMMLEGMPTVDFTPTTLTDDNGDSYTGWSFDLTAGEIYLLASLMYEQYMERDVAHLKTYNVNFTGTEMRVFDPSNARKTFNTMYGVVRERNDYLLDVYKNSDRLTGAYNTIDFAALDFDAGDIYDN